MKNTDGVYDAIPWFWSDQADWKLQIAGLAQPSDDSVEVSEHCIYRFNGESLTAVETINNARVHMLSRKVLSSDHPPTRSELVAANYELKLPAKS